MTRETEARLESAMAAARAAGGLIKESFGKQFRTEFKGHRDLVTEIDRQSERLLRTALHDQHPEIPFWGEEFGRDKPQADLTWIVDPLDGTKNFVHGYPNVAVSIALVRDNIPLIGVVYDPLRDAMFHAVKGGGAFLDGSQLEVSRTARVEDAIVVTGFTLDPPHQGDLILMACQRCQGLRRGGAAALDLCHLAAGHLDAQWEWHLKPWDLAAAALMIEEAQGTVTRIDGGPFDLFGGQILATNTTLHREFVSLLRSPAQAPRA